MEAQQPAAGTQARASGELDWNRRLIELTERVQAALQDVPAARVCADGLALRVREEPSVSSSIVGTIRGVGYRVGVFDGPIAADSYHWYRVGYLGSSFTDQWPGIGWAAGEFLTTSEDLAQCGAIDLDTAARYRSS
jgi:hypothetical protein